MSGKNITAPVPLRNRVLSGLNGNGDGVSPRMLRASSSQDLPTLVKRAKNAPNLLSRTPDPANMTEARQGVEDAQEESLIEKRLERYNLDYPEDYDQYSREALNKESKWFSREKQRKLDLVNLLPYSTETHNEQARYLSQVLVHLYIAIKSMDLEGLVRISTKDLAEVKNNVQLALDTDFFNADLAFDAEDNESEDGDEEDDEVKSSGVIGKVLPRSATVVSVNHWSNELKTCLKMKFDLPLKLRASLAKVYYYLALSTGQSTDLKAFVDMFVRLTKNFDAILVSEAHLDLDHNVLLEYFSKFYPDPDPGFDIYNPLLDEDDRKTFELILKIARNSNPFFGPTAMREIFDWTLQRFSLPTEYVTMNILSHTLPIQINDQDSILNYIPSVFHFWSNASSAKIHYEAGLIRILGKISQGVYNMLPDKDRIVKLEKYGAFTEGQMDFILNRLQGNLRHDLRINTFEEFGKLLIYSIMPENSHDFQNKLQTLLSSLETFVHPSNSGSWSPLIAKFCHRMAFKYHKRVKLESSDDCKIPEAFRLTPEMNKQFIDTFKDTVFLGAQAKSDATANYYVSSICYLSDIPASNSHIIVDRVLLELYDSLTDQYVNSVHRIIVSLKQLTEVSRFMVTDPIYRVHITNILILLVSKLGTNDLTLTNACLNSFVTIVSSIPLKDLSTEDDFVSFESTTASFIQEHLEHLRQLNGEKFQPDEKTVNDAFKASTIAFREICKMFVDKMFLLLEADLNDKHAFKITQTMMIFTESLSEDLFKYFREILYDKFILGDFSSILESEADALFANYYGALVKRDPTLSIKFFKDLDKFIRFEIEQGAGSVRTSTSEIIAGDKKLVLYLMTLAEVVSVSINECLKFSTELLHLIKHLIEKVTNPSLGPACAYLVHKMLKNLTNVKLKENRFIREESADMDYTSYWGILKSSDERFDECNLNFKWYIPGDDEVHAAINMFESIVDIALKRMNELMAQESELSLSSTDDFCNALRFIENCLSGLSILFDPEFHTDTKEDQSKSGLEKKLMILKSLRGSNSDDNDVNIDIEEITKKDDEVHFVADSKGEDATNEDEDLKAELQNVLSGGKFDLDGDQAMGDDDVPSSRLLTPTAPHDSDLTSVMNPSITLRKQHIYNCNYFFGSTAAEKKKHVDYYRVHALRSLIGQYLHSVFVYVTKQKDVQNVKISVAYLQTLRAYFADVGKESSYDADDQLFVDYTFLKKVQAVGNYQKPFSRTCLGARIEKFHRQRIILHSTNRFPSKLDKVLLKDLVELTTSPYNTTSLPGLVCLVDAMRKIIGSYGLILQMLLQHAEDFIKSNELKRLEATLSAFHLNKISNKISCDYKNLKPVLELLNKCVRISDDKVSASAKKQLNSFQSIIKVPSEIALFNEDAIDQAIRPPDRCIDLEITAVRTAKDKKRKLYYHQLDELQDFLLQQIHPNEHWSLSLRNLAIVTNLQQYYELPTKIDALKLLIIDPRSHPSMIKHCIKFISKIVYKVIYLAMYGYSLENSFALDFIRPGVKIVDTSDNYSAKFAEEMKQFENADYYIDGRAHSGWLFWGKNMRVLTAEKSSKFVKVNDFDTKLLREFGSLITKDWLYEVLTSLISDNESQPVFQVANASLISTIIQLNSMGFTSIKYHDLLDLVNKIFNPDEKTNVILSAEIVSGLLFSSHNTSVEDVKLRDEFLNGFLERALTVGLTPETSNVWSVICFWLPARIDFRKMHILHEKLTRLDTIIDPTSNQAFIQSSRILLARNYVANVGWRYPEAEKLVGVLDFKHPYKNVRHQIGGMLATLCHCILKESYDNSSLFLEAQEKSDLGAVAFSFPVYYDAKIRQLFDEIEEERLKINEMTVQDSLHSSYYYMTSTMIQWLKSMFGSPFEQALVPYLKDYIFPFLMNLESNRELCKLAQINLSDVFRHCASKIPYRPDDLNIALEITKLEYSSSHQLVHLLSYIQQLFSRQFMLLSSDQTRELVTRIDSLLFNNSIEVRNGAAQVLSGIIHNCKDLEIVKSFTDKYKKRLMKAKLRQALTQENIIKLHGCTIGLGALISAYPYVSPLPTWLPSQIVVLARASSFSGIVGKAAKDILSDFKKLRADTWHIDRYSFTEDQLEDLEGVLSRSYFA